MASNVSVTYDFVQGTPANADDVDTNFSDITTWINTNAVHLDGTKAFTGLVTLYGADPSASDHATRKGYVDAQVARPIFDFTRENVNVVAGQPTGVTNIDVLTSGFWYYSSSGSGFFEFNFRGSSGTTLSSLVSVGDSLDVVVAANPGGTTHYLTNITIDGSATTIKWVGGDYPLSSTTNATEVYRFKIIKTASAPTYIVLAVRDVYE